MAAVVAVLAAAAWGAAPVERLSPRPNTPCLPHCGDNPAAQECADCCRSVPHETDWKCGTDDAAACCVGAWEPACWDVASTNNFMHACDQCGVGIPNNRFGDTGQFEELGRDALFPDKKIGVDGCSWIFALLPGPAPVRSAEVVLEIKIKDGCYDEIPDKVDQNIHKFAISDGSFVVDEVCLKDDRVIQRVQGGGCPSCPTTSAAPCSEAAWKDLKTGDKVGAVAVPLIVGMLIGGGVVYLLVRKDSRGAFRLL